jgi:hypothetical protein
LRILPALYESERSRGLDLPSTANINAMTAGGMRDALAAHADQLASYFKRRLGKMESTTDVASGFVK